MNTTPQKCLGFMTLHEAFAAAAGLNHARFDIHLSAAYCALT
jgi:hypothetical protein